MPIDGLVRGEDGELIALLRDTGFGIEALVDLYAPSRASGTRFFVPAEWARRWPSEELWVARKA